MIIAVTQYLMRHMVIESFLKVNGFKLQLSDLHFFFLVMATILIAAGGYAINDYFDTRPDRLNKPGKVVIDSQLSRQFAINLHFMLSFIGTSLGIYLSFFVRIPGLSLLFILAAGMLWFYSTNYKKQFFLGNFIVSLLTGTVPILVILFELPLLNREYGEAMVRAGANFNYIFFWVSGFGFFAFLTNLIREIIKDAEDFEGDRAYGMNTFPIVMGITFTKLVVIALILAMLGLLVFILIRFIVITEAGIDYLTSFYFLLSVIFPLMGVIYFVGRARDKKFYHLASQLMKLTMLFGVLYSVIVFYTLNFRLM
jgi:4-hydroxybenzoate polyprenyltransferase